MPPFPLLRLPRFVLSEVFKSLGIGEKIKLSRCSKKISTQINNDRLYSQKIIVNLNCSNYIIIVSCENDKDTIQTFWKNHRKAFLSVVRRLVKMFRCKISFSISCSHSDLFLPTISTLFDLQLEFKALTIPLHMLFNQISSKFGLVEDLIIRSVANPGFIPVFPSWPQNINIKSSYWFTLESLLACTCTHITLEESRLENKDLDVVFRKWKTGGFPNLEYLKIHSLRSTADGEHVLGMIFRELDGMTIQNDDGSKKAAVVLSQHYMEMSVTPIE